MDQKNLTFVAARAAGRRGHDHRVHQQRRRPAQRLHALARRRRVRPRHLQPRRGAQRHRDESRARSLVLCNIHMEMEAHILVARRAVLRGDATPTGRSEIADVPPGTYRRAVCGVAAGCRYTRDVDVRRRAGSSSTSTSTRERCTRSCRAAGASGRRASRSSPATCSPSSRSTSPSPCYLLRRETAAAHDRLQQTARHRRRRDRRAPRVGPAAAGDRGRAARPGLRPPSRSQERASEGHIAPWTTLHYLFFKSPVFTGGVFLVDRDGHRAVDRAARPAVARALRSPPRPGRRRRSARARRAGLRRARADVLLAGAARRRGAPRSTDAEGERRGRPGRRHRPRARPAFTGILEPALHRRRALRCDRRRRRPGAGRHRRPRRSCGAVAAAGRGATPLARLGHALAARLARRGGPAARDGARATSGSCSGSCSASARVLLLARRRLGGPFVRGFVARRSIALTGHAEVMARRRPLAAGRVDPRTTSSRRWRAPSSACGWSWRARSRALEQRLDGARGADPPEGGVPRQRLARAAHAAERHHRLHRHARATSEADAERRDAAGAHPRRSRSSSSALARRPDDALRAEHREARLELGAGRRRASSWRGSRPLVDQLRARQADRRSCGTARRRCPTLHTDPLAPRAGARPTSSPTPSSSRARADHHPRPPRAPRRRRRASRWPTRGSAFPRTSCRSSSTSSARSTAR